MTKTKQFGTFMTNCPPNVEELESSATNPGPSPMLFATSVLRGLRRTLEEVTGAIDSTEAGPTAEEECRKTAQSKSGKSLESRTRQISEPNNLTEDQFDEHWRDVTVSSRSVRNHEIPS